MADLVVPEELIQASSAAREALLSALGPAAALLAAPLKDLFDRFKYTDITRARPVAAALDAVAAAVPEDARVQALAIWTRAALLVLDGQAAEALPLIDEAQARFLALGDAYAVAETQVTQISALAIVGRYDEARGVALAARASFAAAGDVCQVANVDYNLGNIYYYTGAYAQALATFEQAEQVFAAVGDVESLSSARDGRALALVEQGRFAEAVALHASTLALAHARNDLGLVALSNNNLGYLYSQQGLYHRAISYFQQAQQLFAELGIEQEQKASELELAQAYLLLNLFDEVVHRCGELVVYFRARSMPFECAYALALLGMARGRLGDTAAALDALREGEQLFAEMDSLVWVANLRLCQAELALAGGENVQASALAAQAAMVLAAAGLEGRLAQARWLRGEALRRLGSPESAQGEFRAALSQAERRAMLPLQQRCATSMGALALEAGDQDTARRYFLHAVELIEHGRAPLPAEELRVAYFADKLAPYEQLVRLALADGQVAAVFAWIERVRARALLDLVQDVQPRPNNAVADPVYQRYNELRRSLQLAYNRLNLPGAADEQGPAAAARLEQEIAAAEHELADLDRRLRADGGGDARPLALEQAQALLDPDTQLISFWICDGNVSALLVDREHARLLPAIAQVREVEVALRQLRLQIGKIDFGTDFLARHQTALLAATNHYLQVLYTLLIAPFAADLSGEKLVLVPHGLLHYLPFAALHDGASYLIQRHALAFLPAASMLAHLRPRPACPISRPLLVGVPDAAVPQIEQEIAALSRQFPAATRLEGPAATEAAVRRHVPQSDALHLACHGIFRPTSPLFSSLRLADTWLTVRDISTMDLTHCQIVSLSACETGVSTVAPGDELLGLARGFLSAGAPALLLSQWPTDDRAAAALMPRFYAELQAGKGYAEALRQAGLDVLAEFPNPAHWAAFFVMAS